MPYEYSRKGGKSVPVYLVSLIPAKPRFPPVRRALFQYYTSETLARRRIRGRDDSIKYPHVKYVLENKYEWKCGVDCGCNSSGFRPDRPFGRTAKNCQRLSCRPISVGLGVRNGARLDAHCPRSRGWRVLSRKKQNRKTKT